MYWAKVIDFGSNIGIFCSLDAAIAVVLETFHARKFQAPRCHQIHQPDVSVKKMKIKGEIVSSAPDIICYGFEGKVLCVVEVKKKIKGDDVFGLPVIKKTRHALSEVDPCLPDSLLAQHIGELLAYVDSSVTHMDLCGSVGRDILGFTVEKTLVRDIF
uniref:Uncharacterized protein n=1 Tax=Magallana gigas TaxID=29159 RepID=K1R123_MAGGI